MDFQHTEERRMLADALERYLSEQYDFATRQAVANGAEGRSPRHWRELVELGAVGVLFPDDVGGLGGGAFDVEVVFESLGHWLVVEPFLDTLMVGRALLEAGDRARVRELVGGTRIGVMAHDEPDNHYETTRVATRARETDDGWILNGTKTVVRNAEQADFLLVSARTSGEESAAEGITLFAVPRGTTGLVVRGYQRIDGGRAGEVTLDKVEVPAEAQVGVPDRGATLLAAATRWGLLALCAEALGAMDTARRYTLDYLRTRKQFGVPIGSFQALQHRMADLLLEIEQARSAVINAGAAMDKADPLRERTLSAAKYSIGHIGTHVAEESIQLHGGIGMTWELPLPHYAKRLVMIDHELGDEDHHLQRYIALGRRTAVAAA